MSYGFTRVYSAVDIIFPTSFHLLCRFHIQKNVKAKIKMYVEPKSAWDFVMDYWGTVIDCPSVDDFEGCLTSFERTCCQWPIFVDYTKDT